MSSANQNPFLDTTTSHRISSISEEAYHDRRRSASRDSDPDAISPIESHEPARPGLNSGSLEQEAAPAHLSNRTTTSGTNSRPARAVKAVALPTLRYHRRSLCLLGCYIPFLVVPWALTCVMAVRPLNLPSYNNQMGRYGANSFLWIFFWWGFVKVVNSIASLMTVPVLSALLAQGAVVYSQRRKMKQALNLRQLFALSDRGWADIPYLWNAMRGSGASSKYLWLAAGLLILSAIQAPIQQALVTTETFFVMTCDDNPLYDFAKYCNPGRLPIVVGYDPEPADLAHVPQNAVVLETAKNVLTVSDLDVELRLWHEPTTSAGNVDDDLIAESNTFFWYYESTQPGNPTYFVSALPNATTTGILREHAMRLNSTVACTDMAPEDFPATCGGVRPLTTSYSSTQELTIDICVPGDYSKTPWTLSRNRQDLEEELYIKVHVPYNSSFDLDDLVQNFTTYCKSTTTRGYFEMGNYHNNYVAGPLIETWPDNITMIENFNDYLNFAGSYGIPSVVDNTSTSFPDWSEPPDPFETWELSTPGPLMTSALALFGNQSFFYVAANSSASAFPSTVAQICQSGNIPFTRLGLLEGFGQSSEYCEDINSRSYETYNDNALNNLMYVWFLSFNYTPYAVEALSTSVFFASQAWLTQTADATWTDGARQIFTSPGLEILRPAKSLAETIIVSSLIFLQLVGLAVLGWYIYTVPTWTVALDSLAVARLAKSIGDDDLPPIGPVSDKDLEKLRKVDGLVGVMDDESPAVVVVDATAAGALAADEQEPKSNDGLLETHSTRPASSQCDRAVTGSAMTSSPFKLARGAPGLISKRHAPPKKKKEKQKKKRKVKNGTGSAPEMVELRVEEV